MEVREIELKGHIIDSLILPKVFDVIMDLGGNFEVLQFEIGKHKTEPSYARIMVKGKSRKHLDQILGELHKVGASIPEVEIPEFKPAADDRVLPGKFYSTTNHPTYLFLNSKWRVVENIEMDCVIVVEGNKALCKPISEVKKGDLVVVGKKGIRVEPPERPRGYSV
ncbi:MAG: TIGR00300 family protein, partial [Candidatus Hydrothermarchaeaceae archaeon]